MHTISRLEAQASQHVTSETAKGFASKVRGWSMRDMLRTCPDHLKFWVHREVLRRTGVQWTPRTSTENISYDDQQSIIWVATHWGSSEHGQYRQRFA